MWDLNYPPASKMLAISILTKVVEVTFRIVNFKIQQTLSSY